MFRGIDRWGYVNGDSLHINSLVPLLRSLFADAGIASAQSYSGHSLRYVEGLAISHGQFLNLRANAVA